MWEAHFGAVYDAIPYTFYQCEDVVVLGVKDDLLQRRLFRISTCSAQFAVRIPTSSACNLSMSRSQRQTGFNRASVQADDAQSQLLDLASSLEQRRRVKRREMGKNGGRVKPGTLDRVASWSETAGYGAGCARPAVWPRLFASHYRRRLPHIRCPRSR